MSALAEERLDARDCYCSNIDSNTTVDLCMFFSLRVLPSLLTAIVEYILNAAFAA